MYSSGLWTRVSFCSALPQQQFRIWFILERLQIILKLRDPVHCRTVADTAQFRTATDLFHYGRRVADMAQFRMTTDQFIVEQLQIELSLDR